MPALVLSIFPGIDLLGLAFEQEGYCVVRGPDVLWGGDVRRFHPPAGVFNGVLGGPPCQLHSQMAVMDERIGKHGDLIDQFVRCVREAQPEWFLMENAHRAPDPQPPGYRVHRQVLDNRWLGAEQHRVRGIWFGTKDGRRLDLSPELPVFEAPVFRHAVLAGHGATKWQRERAGTDYGIPGMCRLQGLPEDFADELPFTTHGKRRVIGNGVPLPMGRAIARAVKRASERQEVG